jgi:nucleoside phosphorylase
VGLNQTQPTKFRTGWDLVICAGAAGGLDNSLSVGDIVVATETIEHDIRNKFGKPRMPSYTGDEKTIQTMRQLGTDNGSFQLHFGAIASGDEDVVDVERQEELKWDRRHRSSLGRHGKVQFSETPFVEIADQ